MIGGSISRWTMTYFAAALTWLLAVLTLMIVGIGHPATDLAAPDTLVLVHVVCIGWLSLAMCGALFQFVPVLVARPLFSERWALPALALLTAGLVSLLAGFMALGGRLPSAPWLLPLGAVLLVTGFSLVVVDLGLTAWQRPTGPARFVLVGLASLCATVVFGTVFAFALAGWAGRIGEVVLARGIPLHAIAGLGGWLTLTAMGVSYRLLAMFMLAPDVEDRQSRLTLVAGALAVAMIVGGGAAAIGFGAGLNTVLAIAALLGLVCATLYGRDLASIFRTRKRHHLELNMRMALLSFASLAGTGLLGVALVSTATLPMHVGALAFLAVFGWLSGLVLAKLYKIVAFLTWLETYGPVMGRAPTPRVQDLVAERRATKWFATYYVSVWMGTLALLAKEPDAFRMAAVAMTVGVVGIVHEIVRIRRLEDVASPLRLPAGAVAPHLLFAKT
ncbi:hypothetical protein [Bradyrhizobium betae]|uniref:Cbb3-type cytochrome c oxidase subunit I n=1 Tax=Bradyrhizobium betae TaxID=244734 RepID=A0A5P6PEI2_9BRAD|nr:hypothetical protein [Bradyrhizobium betae]MCS3726164.1 hypothetical protein [Bradyrhizobium betae]QFI76759.1 hypothetical protein F8237_32780 [Bradyrhizobium betae]